VLRKPSGHGIGVPMKATVDDVRLSNRAPFSCDGGSLHGIWARQQPSDAIADRDDARHRDGVAGSVTARSSDRATLVAMVEGHEFELQGEATTNPKREQGSWGGQKRGHAEDGMTAAPKTLCISVVSTFEQTQALVLPPCFRPIVSGGNSPRHRLQRLPPSGAALGPMEFLHLPTLDRRGAHSA